MNNYHKISYKYQKIPTDAQLLTFPFIFQHAVHDQVVKISI